MFPLHVWMTGSGTQFNMNVNESFRTAPASSPVRRSGPSRRCTRTMTSTCRSRQMTRSPRDVHRSRNRRHRQAPPRSPRASRRARCAREGMEEIIKVGRTHLQDAHTAHTRSGVLRIRRAARRRHRADRGCPRWIYRLSLGGTAVGTGINSPPGFDVAVAAEIASLTGLPFVSAPNKFTVQGSHDANRAPLGNATNSGGFAL